MPPIVPAEAQATTNLSLIDTTNDYAPHVNDVKVTNDAKGVTWKGGTPTALLTDVIATSYTLEISIVNDYDNADSLFNHLINEAGEKRTFVYKPDVDGTFSATVEATVIEPMIGGPVDKFGGQTLKMPCTKPVIVQPS